MSYEKIYFNYCLCNVSILFTGCKKNDSPISNNKKLEENTIAKPSVKSGFEEKTLQEFSYQYSSDLFAFVDYKSGERYDRFRGLKSSSAELEVNHNYISNQKTGETIIRAFHNFEDAKVSKKTINGSVWYYANKKVYYKSDKKDKQVYYYVSLMDGMYYMVHYVYNDGDTEYESALKDIENSFYISKVFK